MIRATFYDIDGTLVSFNTHRIPDSTVAALEQLKRQGTGIYISTGRPPAIINNLQQIEHLIDGYITTNGAYSFIGEDVVTLKTIDPDDAETVMQEVKEIGCASIVVCKDAIAIVNLDEQMEHVFGEKLGLEHLDLFKQFQLFKKDMQRSGIPQFNTYEEVRRHPILQITPFFTPEQEAAVMKRLKNCTSGRWHPAFTDITCADADKGQALVSMANHLGINIEETMAFGDGGNDLTILHAAGVGVAMGNAIDCAREAADYITTSVDEDGIWNALKHYHVI